MMYWLQKNPQLVGVLLGAGIAGVVALVTGWLNNRASMRRMRLQLDGDRERDAGRLQAESQRARLDARRERLEELHVLVGRSALLQDQHALLVLSMALGKLSRSQYLDQQSKLDVSRSDHTRTKTLVAMYGGPEIQETFKASDSAYEAYMEARAAVDQRTTMPQLPAQSTREELKALHETISAVGNAMANLQEVIASVARML